MQLGLGAAGNTAKQRGLYRHSTHAKHINTHHVTFPDGSAITSNATVPNPLFFITTNAAYTDASAAFPWDHNNKIENGGSGWNSTTYKYAVPMAGDYQILANFNYSRDNTNAGTQLTALTSRIQYNAGAGVTTAVESADVCITGSGTSCSLSCVLTLPQSAIVFVEDGLSIDDKNANPDTSLSVLYTSLMITKL